MPDLDSMEELNQRQLANTEISGEGIHGVTQHFPCPMCGAPDWYVVKIIDFAETSPEITCGECGRTFQLVYKKLPNGSSIECVQTGGADQPDWMEPKMKDCRHE